MAQQISVSSRLHHEWFLPLIAALAFVSACDSTKKAEAEGPTQAPTLEGELARVSAVEGVRKGLRSAYSATIRAEQATEQPQRPPREFAQEGRRASIIFTANNRGEREDCGCKSNPLGGLGRRHSLIDFTRAGGEEAARWWGEPSAPVESLFVVDAGDLFYKSANVDRMSPHQQDVAKIDARTVAKSLALSPPDVYVASELDLAFGAGHLAELAELAGTPVVSANLYRDGERLFPAGRVVERGGMKVAFLGITKPESRIADYFSSRELDVKPMVASYKEALKELSADLDLVVLLSNAGVPDTQKAVEQLVAAGVRVDAAVVSNSNRLLKAPLWAAGVPLVEPLSRGKWLGRVDVVLRGDDVDFIDERRTPDDLERRYRRAQGAWLNSETRRLAESKRLLQAKIELRDRAAEPGGDEAADAPEKPRGARPNVEFLEKRVDTMARQSGIAYESVAELVAELRALEKGDEKPEGDDEFVVRTRELALDIPEEVSVRRVIDAAEKKKPAEPKSAGRKVNVPPRERGHDH